MSKKYIIYLEKSPIGNVVITEAMVKNYIKENEKKREPLVIVIGTMVFDEAIKQYKSETPN